jgi:hypothetical protein
MALLAAIVSGACPAAAGRARRATHRKPSRLARVLSQGEIDAYLEAEEMKWRAARRESEARAAAVAGSAARVREAADLAPDLLEGGAAPELGPGGRLHRAVIRRPPGAPPPSVAGVPPR